MIKALDTWRQKSRNRSMYRQLSCIEGRILADAGIKHDDLKALQRGYSPWETA